MVAHRIACKGQQEKGRKNADGHTARVFPECKPVKEDMLFADFLQQWLQIAKPTIALTTYSSYSNMVNSIIEPHFRELGVTLNGLKAADIQAFYMEQLKRVKPNSVIHYHAVIHKALKYAVKLN